MSQRIAWYGRKPPHIWWPEVKCSMWAAKEETQVENWVFLIPFKVLCNHFFGVVYSAVRHTYFDQVWSDSFLHVCTVYLPTAGHEASCIFTALWMLTIIQLNAYQLSKYKHRVALISTSLLSFEYLYILINLPFFPSINCLFTFHLFKKN